ncbi:MAG TPA: hypothetical protein PKA27_13640 [Fimbriimonadaceae bacterium]|nr:hypothetical protein [Fimbriimonadaceae bacterium]
MNWRENRAPNCRGHVERQSIERSFAPQTIPLASGTVWVYNKMPTVVIVSSKDEVVTTVYAGKS